MGVKSDLVEPIRKIRRIFEHAITVALILCTFPYPVFSYEVIREVQGGQIRGVVRWKGETVPEQYIHQVVKNTDFCGETFVDDALVINPENLGMQNVVVYLENIVRGRKPLNRFVNVIKGCRFHPRVMGVVKGGLIGFRHDDFITHNIHIFRLENNATVLNFGLPIHRWQQTITRKNRKTGLFRLQCDIHTHMNGLMVSLEHDYFSSTNGDGAFEIREIPPGKYRIVAFQGGHQIQNFTEKGKKGFRPIYEKPHKVVKEVEVEINETSEVLFEFDLDN